MCTQTNRQRSLLLSLIFVHMYICAYVCYVVKSLFVEQIRLKCYDWNMVTVTSFVLL